MRRAEMIDMSKCSTLLTEAAMYIKSDRVAGLFALFLTLLVLPPASSADTGGRASISTSNTIAPGTPSGCLTPAHTCVTIPVNISRTDATGARGYSVTFSLSAELSLCSGTSSITEGTYLSTGHATTFFVTDNGGGSYTVDGAILGQPCGATASSGTLFNVAVTNSASSGTGTITISSVTLRACNNAVLSSTAGGPGSVTIDPTPVTVASIADKTVAETATLTV